MLLAVVNDRDSVVHEVEGHGVTVRGSLEVRCTSNVTDVQQCLDVHTPRVPSREIVVFQKASQETDILEFLGRLLHCVRESSATRYE